MRSALLVLVLSLFIVFFSSRRRHTRCLSDWSSDVCSSDLSTGWQLVGLASLASGSPFTVYSGIQQTGAGSNGSDRPDQIGQPELSTSRQIREDYFGRGADNASYFAIPIGVPSTTPT